MTRLKQQANSQYFEKHRQDVRDYAVDWANELATGETLSGNPTVVVIENGSDVSSEFGVSGETTSGTQSQFRLTAAGAGNQDAESTYYIRVSQGTSSSQTLNSVHRLYVSELADTAAP